MALGACNRLIEQWLEQGRTFRIGHTGFTNPVLRHRLLCGDSTVATAVERVLGGVAPHLMVTDPPYGVNYDPAWRNQAGRSINGTTQRIATGTVIKPIGARAVGKVVNDDRADWREAWRCSPARWPMFGTPGPRPASCRTA